MSQPRLLLRCYAEAVDGQWQAFCLDFDLAAQADTFEEARAKLETMLAEYVYDALAGEDREFADQLLSRRAPWPMWAKFYFYVFRHRVLRLQSRVHRLFKEPIPLVPSCHCHA